MHIEFIHQNIYGVGGTVRSVINLANALSAHHHVTITSVFQRVPSPSLAIDPKVAVRPLVDLRPDGVDRGDVRHNRVSRIVPPAEEYFRQYSELTDERITSHLRSSTADVIIGTRPSLNLLVAEFGSRGATLVAQEHMTHSAIPRTVVRRMRELYGNLGLVTAVTEADRQRIVDSLDLPDQRVRVLPNSIPTPVLSPSKLDTRLVFAVGRLAPEKRYDVLLDAFALSALKMPGWRLRIYGDGPSRASLERKAERLGIRSLVDFMGSITDMESEWPRASLVVSTSDRESFGMTIVEAMRNGVPVVSTDCPDGPREIITHGVDGVLVPDGRPDNVAAEMIRLMSGDAEREALGMNASTASQRYSPQAVADSFLSLLRLAGARPSGRTIARDAFAVAVAVAKMMLRPSRRIRPTSDSVILSASVDSTVRAHGAPVGSFWKDAAGTRVQLDEHGETSAGELTSGIWNLHAPTSTTGSRRLRVSLIDAANLATSNVTPARNFASGFKWEIPYRTYDGYAAVKVWNEHRQAELVNSDWSDDCLVISCHLLGAWDPKQPILPVLSKSPSLSNPRFLSPVPHSDRVELRVDASYLRSIWLQREERFFVGIARHETPTSMTPVSSTLSDIPDLRRRRRFPEKEILESAAFSSFHTTPARRLFIQPTFARDNTLMIRLSER